MYKPKSRNKMLFKDTKAGYPIYLLDKDGVKATHGRVVSVSTPRVQTPQVGAFPQNPLAASLVVDVTIEVDGTTRTYTMPETSTITYAGNIALSTEKESILREIQALKTVSEEALSKVEAHRQTIENCNKVLEEWDTTFAEINLMEDKKSIEETEADDFALNAILPNADWKKFLAKTRNVVPYKIAPHIQIEAGKHNVNPQLLFGRYKHDIGIYKIKNPFERKIL